MKEQSIEILSKDVAANEKGIVSRDKTIKELRAEVAAQKANNSLLSEELSTQQSHVEELQQETQALTKKLNSVTKPAPSAVVGANTVTTSTNNSNSACEVSRSTLLGSLQCALCEGLLVDAVVLRCSHGFCRACIEQHWKGSRDEMSKKNKYASSKTTQAALVCRCPQCNALSPAVTNATDSASRNAHSSASSSSKAGCSAHYVRSDHLDSLVWLLLEASGASTERKVSIIQPSL